MGSMKHARLMCRKAITNAVDTKGQKPTTKAGKSKEKNQRGKLLIDEIRIDHEIV